MTRALGALVACVLVAPTAARAANVYAADVWPSKVAVRPDGSLEYTYDLRPVKAGKVQPDVQAEVGEAAAAAFLKGLPNEVKALADPSTASLSISAPGEPEHATPTSSFSTAPAGVLAPSSEFDKAPSVAGLPALHHDVPKLIPSVDMLMWKSRQIEDGILASVLAASERGSLGLPMGRRAFWNAVLAAAVKRYQGAGEGDARDGAMALAVHVGAALRASEGSMPAALAGSERLTKAVEAEPSAAKSAELNPGLIAAYGFTPEIGNLENSESAFARPLPDTRPGLAGALVFLSILERDPKLAKAYVALRRLRDDLLGPADAEVLDVYQATAKDGAAKALDELGEFLPQVEAKTPQFKSPRLFAPPQTPIRQFLGSLEGAERGNALDELAAALQDGRVAPDASPKGSWALLRESALVPLLKPEDAYGSRLVVLGSYRGRLSGAFRALFHAGADPGQDAAGESSSDEGAVTPVLKVRLKVPPHVQVEPLPTLYGRLATGYQRLRDALAAEGGAGKLPGLTPTGARRPSPARAEADQLAHLYRGLELLALRAAGPAPVSTESAGDQKRDLAAAEHFVSGWRTDFDLGRSLRSGGSDSEAQLSVTRRQLEVAFDGAPKTQVLGFADAEKNPFVADTTASQGYLVPVLTMAPPPASTSRDAP